MIYRRKNRGLVIKQRIYTIGVLVFLTLGSSYFVKSQNLNPTLSIHQNDVKMVFHYKEIEISPKDNVMYYWTKYRKVHHTEGGYAGQLLNGKYEEYFISGQLKTNGAFKKGAKVGEWKSWFENGVTEEINSWVKGLMHGKYIKYYDDGKIKEEGRFKFGLKHGTVFQYDIEGHKEKLKFKNGKQVDSAFKKNKRVEEKGKKKEENAKRKAEKEEKRVVKKKEREERELQKVSTENTEEERPIEKLKLWWNTHLTKKKE
jgi:hypothetical protein